MVFSVTHRPLADQKPPGRYRLVLVVNALTFKTRPTTNSKSKHCKPLTSLRNHQRQASSIGTPAPNNSTPTVGAARAEPLMPRGLGGACGSPAGAALFDPLPPEASREPFDKTRNDYQTPSMPIVSNTPDASSNIPHSSRPISVRMPLGRNRHFLLKAQSVH